MLVQQQAVLSDVKIPTSSLRLLHALTILPARRLSHAVLSGDHPGEARLGVLVSANAFEHIKQGRALVLFSVYG